MSTPSLPVWLRGLLAFGLSLALVVFLWLNFGQESGESPADSGNSELSQAPASAQNTSRPPEPSSTTDNGPGMAGTVEVVPGAADFGEHFHSDDEPPENDNDLLDGTFRDFRGLFQQGNPVGMNEDITAALLGENTKRLALIPPNHPSIKDGQIHDRWGTPFWFHAASANVMEIRSAGPDRELFTGDDVVINDTGVEATLYQQPDSETDS